MGGFVSLSHMYLEIKEKRVHFYKVLEVCCTTQISSIAATQLCNFTVTPTLLAPR